MDRVELAECETGRGGGEAGNSLVEGFGEHVMEGPCDGDGEPSGCRIHQ